MQELVVWFQEKYPDLVRDMLQCTHHRTEVDDFINGNKDICVSSNPTSLNPYHLEGDVWAHTMMVCKQAENLNYLAKVSALLHDIGKPSTRAVNPKNGRVSFFNHDAVSAFMSLKMLKDLAIPKEDRHVVFNAIALHTQVYKQDQKKLCKDLGNLLAAETLLSLGRADHEGRFSTAGEFEKIDFVDIIKYAKEPVKVDKEKEVVILCGLPGSGKSTWVEDQKKKWNQNEINLSVSRDEIVENLGKGDTYNEKWENVDQKAVDKHLRDNLTLCCLTGAKQVIVDMTHMSKKSRRRTLSHFNKDYKKTCVVFLPDLETIYLRNDKRDGKNIDREVIDRMMKSFYPPTYEEFDEIIWRF